MAIGDKERCQFCKNEYSPFNVKKHEEKCAMNPINGITLGSSAETIQSAPILTPKIEVPTTTSIKIRNVLFLPDTKLIACFKQDDSESIIEVPISFVGIIVMGEEETSSLLIVGSNGLLQAPIMMDGFVGIKEKSNELETSTGEEYIPKETINDTNPLPEDASVTDMVNRIQEMKNND